MISSSRISSPCTFSTARTPGSGSHSGPPIVSTRTGYANAPGTTRGDVSYPRYPTPGDDDAALQLTPNRRPLYIGLGIAAVGIGILLVMTLGNKDEVKDEPTVNMNAGPPERSGSAEAPTPGTPETVPPAPVKPPDPTASTATTAPAGGSAAETQSPPAPAVADTSIQVKITSDPEGAEVLLGEKLIGTTPLTTKLTRASETKTLTIRKAKFTAVTKDLDLSKDFTTEVALEKVPVAEVKKPPPPEVKKPPEVRKPPATTNATKGNTTTTTSKNPTNTPPPPPKPACQQPSQYDPTDPRPPCKT